MEVMSDGPKATMREPGDPEDIPDTVAERAVILRDYLRLLAENPEDYLGILGKDTERHQQWSDRAAFAAEVIDSSILWDPSDTDMVGMAAASWAEMQEVVDNADDIQKKA